MMGDSSVYPEEGPVREVAVAAFAIDAHEVTVGQFRRFAEATGYVTRAEKAVDPADFGVPREQIPAYLLEPGSAVFVAPERPSAQYRDWWRYVPGANWRLPKGPDGAAASPRDPVVHLAYEDMQAYAAWRGGRLPSEAEWEYAARAGEEKFLDQPPPEKANSWQGVFPVVNEETDGFFGVAPVACFEPNAWGLYDMVGNVWEMTADTYRPGHDVKAIGAGGVQQRSDDSGSSSGAGPERVVKGGSYLCAPNYCQRYRPAARQGRDPGLGTSNVGFRLVYDRLEVD